ncbi:hypothetical protein [Dyella telluris]|uniref:Uncharacterized protein n=1 Tax=Dyella telluris TaxID=2763498 RepID=A0A7G8QB07_9GAMM|nr:hypothetical protein [Dyella telluris]QNK03965.1 hypothetical protein H8F01_02445 [Dyella telluris]
MCANAQVIAAGDGKPSKVISSAATSSEQGAALPGTRNGKRSGVLFIAAGCMFLLAAAIGRFVVFGGVGVLFVVLGASTLARAVRK